MYIYKYTIYTSLLYRNEHCFALIRCKQDYRACKIIFFRHYFSSDRISIRIKFTFHKLIYTHFYNVKDLTWLSWLIV